MFYCKIENTKIDRAHLKSLSTLYSTQQNQLKSTLDIPKDTPKKHIKNLLMIEIYESVHNLYPEFMWNLYNNKNNNTLHTNISPSINRTTYVIN